VKGQRGYTKGPPSSRINHTALSVAPYKQNKLATKDPPPVAKTTGGGREEKRRAQRNNGHNNSNKLEKKHHSTCGFERGRHSAAASTRNKNKRVRTPIFADLVNADLHVCAALRLRGSNAIWPFKKSTAARALTGHGRSDHVGWQRIKARHPFS
jgi:hypothetical protein